MEKINTKQSLAQSGEKRKVLLASSAEANRKVLAVAVSGLHSHHSKHENTESLTKPLSEPAGKQKPINFIPEEPHKAGAAETPSARSPRQTRLPPRAAPTSPCPLLPAWKGGRDLEALAAGHILQPAPA